MATVINECGETADAGDYKSCIEEGITLPELELPVPSDNGETIKIPSVTDVTTEKIDGTGVFDIYMRAGLEQLSTQYELGRIKGPDFAMAYVAQVELMMTEANKFVLGVVQAEIQSKMFGQEYLSAQYENALKMQSVVKMKAEAELVCKQISELGANGAQDRSLKAAQTSAQCKTVSLYDRQIKGFDEKNQNDIFKTIMDSWAVQGVDITADQALSTVVSLNKDPIHKMVNSAIKDTDLVNGL